MTYEQMSRVPMVRMEAGAPFDVVIGWQFAMCRRSHSIHCSSINAPESTNISKEAAFISTCIALDACQRRKSGSNHPPAISDRQLRLECPTQIESRCDHFSSTNFAAGSHCKDSHEINNGIEFREGAVIN